MYLFVFLYGMVIGSFLNVCIWRIPRKESILYPSSHCPNCDTTLKSYDLFPIISYLFTGGNCRYCGVNISIQYPFVELANGIIYLLIFHKYGISTASIEFCLLGSLLLTIGLIDYHHQIIPDSITITGFLVVLVFHISKYVNNPESLLHGLVGLLIGGGFFLLLAIITNGGMGGGDIKLMGLLGLWLGWKWILLVTLLAFVLGAFISILLILLKIKNRKDMIPFGPFIGLATILIVLYGNTIMNYYLVFL